MLRLSDLNKKHLSYLIGQDETVVKDFCRLAWDYLAKGVNAKLYATAAQKLEISPQDLQHVVEALVNLLSESCKLKLSIPKLKSNLLELGFNSKQVDIICTYYTTKRADINNVLLAASVQLPMYKDLEWRTQVQLASRALPEQLEPSILMKLKLDNAKEDSLILQTDPGNLVHITKVLQDALNQASDNHTSRVQRRYKT
ncbi:COMM domain-containing protein 2-like [Cimex lectularius]|uniref:COMM domain-containing protein n=1 Tax=Cimex lectularius TaxID=79782 RepID=A0A8I6RHD4_CIMLE|nr:COMM domain-containing protein 2-like [Cimex lectularius]